MLMCCLSCAKADRCEQADRVEDFCLNYEERPMTNADRIRAMTNEELAETFYTGCESRAYNDNCLITQKLIELGDLAMSDEEQDEICLKCWLSWLKSPADKEGEG